MTDHPAGRRGFVQERVVSFADCDPARIAYTGRLADFALEAIEAFWSDVLDGESWFEFNLDHGLGTPFVKMEMEFSAPVTPRCKLSLHVEPAALGSSSIAFRIEGFQERRSCFVGRFVCVFISIESFEKIPVPGWIREKLERRFEIPKPAP
ncbi:thioesterase family protein [Neomegalonema sp.]|uniref:acyl-CoA thioesterase n=1 Tax=Neomegalonema sp. TaxID=2039713 RepID=UPI0026136100|nr:thioesterase family protein [Neomegalonema sp.]MDD2867735.1 hotdog domain-containing protein [Neomegalonema sp.]